MSIMTNFLKKIDVKTEMERRRNKRQTLLGYLKENGSITTSELWKFGGTGASTRLCELRKEGHNISHGIYERPGVFRYVYRGER